MSAVQGSGLEGCLQVRVWIRGSTVRVCAFTYVGSLLTAGWRDKLQRVPCTIGHSIST